MKRNMLILIPIIITLIGIATFTPVTGQDQTDERLSALETRVAILETQMAAPTSDVIEPVEQYTLTGSITLVTGLGNLQMTGRVGQPGTSCAGRNGYDDMHEGTAVQIVDEAGRIIAVGRLNVGKPLNDSLRTCVFSFNVDGIPRADFYTIEVSHRAKLTYSFAELESANWLVRFELSNS